MAKNREYNSCHHSKICLEHNRMWLTSILKQYSFGDDLIKWIKILLKNQESCVSNNRKKTFKSYFKQERGTQQGDPILVYLYTLVLEIALTLIKTNNNIEDLNIFNHNLLCTVYADYTTLFIKNINYAIKIKTFIFIFLVLQLITQNAKSRKGVKLALCGYEIC